MTANTWKSTKNILCIRLDAIGDVLMTTPAIRALKASHPNRRITLLTSPAGTAAASLIPELDDVIVYDAPWMKATAPRSNSRPEFDMVERLRQKQFDGAVIFTVYSQNPLPSALLCYLADIPLRLAHCHENPYQLLTDWVLDPEPGGGIRHEVQRQLDLVANIGCRIDDERMSIKVSESDRQHIFNLLAHLRIDVERPWLVIHPGATALSRRYPPEGFARVAEQLILDNNFQVLFTGTEPERELIQGIQASMTAPSQALIGCLNLGQMVGLIAIAPLLLSNNTGPVHIAASVGTPVVDLYALTNPQHTPWGVPHRVLFQDVPCKFCYKSICPEGHYHCLRLVSPEQIVRAVCELFTETTSGIATDNHLSTVSLSLPITQYSAIAPTPAMQQSAQEIWR